jgi:hypothetical protein
MQALGVLRGASVAGDDEDVFNSQPFCGGFTMFRHAIARSTLVLAAALAAVSATGLVDVASAATPRPVAVQVGPITNPEPLPPTVVARKVSHTASAAFSAGIAGYDDATCGGLLGDLQTAVDYQQGALGSGDFEAADKYGSLASNIYDQMTGNCVVID